MVFEAKIVTDSISPARSRLTTFALRYPRFVHAELMTHRLFSRNASSSRAIPVKTILQQLEEDPAMPVFWGLNEKGMQARSEADSFTIEAFKTLWLEARDSAIEYARTLNNMGLHKQLVNRLLEPWSHITVVVTATEWDNFFDLRCNPDAQPEIKAVADRMRDLYYANTPSRVEFGGWHLPFIQDEEKHAPGNYAKKGHVKNEGNLVKASTARCARVSYLTHDKKRPDLDLDIVLHDRLFGSKHMSPFEHPAQPLTNPDQWSGNFKGWVQYRKMLKGEAYTNYTPPTEQ